MRILHVAASFEPAWTQGGIVRAQADMVRGLADLGHHVDVFTTTHAQEVAAPGLRWAPESGVHARYFTTRAPSGYVWSPALGAALKSAARTYAVVHIHGLWTYPCLAAARAARRARVPYVVTLHGALHPWALAQRPLRKWLHLKVAGRRYLRDASLIHCTTDSERRMLWDQLPSLRATVLPLGLPRDAYGDLPQLGVARASSAVSAGAPWLVVLARVHPMKGIDRLIRALARCRGAGQKAILSVVGPEEGNHGRDLRRLAHTLGIGDRVKFHGAVFGTRRYAWLQDATLFCLTSHRENFGLSVAEAVAAGTPVLVSEHVDLATWVRASRLGWVTTMDPDDIARNLDVALADPSALADIRSRARAVALAEFDGRRIASALVAEYERIRKPRVRGRVCNSNARTLELADLLTSLFAALRVKGHSYCVLGKGEPLPQYVRHDVDMLVSDDAAEGVAETAEEVGRLRGWTVVRRERQWKYASITLQLLSDSSQTVRVDIFSGYHWGWMPHGLADSVLPRAVERDGVRLAPDGADVALRVIKQVARGLHVRPSERDHFSAALGSDPTSFYAALQPVLPRNVSVALGRTIASGRWTDLHHGATRVRANLLAYAHFRRPWILASAMPSWLVQRLRRVLQVPSEPDAALIAKRILDIAVSFLALVISLPLLCVLALVLRLVQGSPVLFRQTRPGLHGAPFRLYKFRTMRAGPGTDAERLTRIGRIIRALSLDELPQLINVLKGDMSLVGPRPLLMEYNDRYSPEQRRRLDAVPGITGWAQVNGRNAISWERKFELDVWYVDHRSFWLDLKILLLTAWNVLTMRGIRQSGHATMPEFLGSPARQKERVS